MSGWQEITLYSRLMMAVCTVLCLIIVTEIYLVGADANAHLAGSVRVESNIEPAATVADSATLQIPPVVTYREFVERPLFSDSRRPPQDATTSVESVRAVQLTSKWKVTGIVMAAEDSFVHIEGIRDHKTVRLQVGMPLDGWKLERISPEQVEFRSASGAVTLPLHENKDKDSSRRK
jgi:hypothetical protein